MGSSELYRLLQQQEQDFREETPPCPRGERTTSSSKRTLTIVILLLLTSLSHNAILAYKQFQLKSRCRIEGPTQYAGLIRNVAIPFTTDEVFGSINRIVADAAWMSLDLEPDAGLVALKDDWVRSKGLPKAQRFPWDDSKGLYVLNGFYNLHCLHLLRQSVLEAYDGVTQTLPRSQVMHCLNAFREDIVCNADDTPRYTGRVNQQASAVDPISGTGQKRQCKDWRKLREWAIEHSACYKGVDFDDPGFHSIERYKFCPNGEKLWP